MTRAALLLLLCVAACRLDQRNDYVGDNTPRHLGIGRPAPPALIAAEDIDVAPSGEGLPPGQGRPAEGAKIYAAKCASCHGANGEGQEPAYPQLVGGPKGTFDFASDPKIPRTIGNYWPYATTLFGYIRRAMPLTAPRTLSANEIYAVTAYLLSREGLFPANGTMDAPTLVRIQMPAREHFVTDDRRGSTGGKHVR